MTLHRTYSRNGLTLLEVVLAMAIFLMSSIAIWQLVVMGSDRAMDIRQETRTSARCQAKMAQVIIGEQPLTSSGSYAPFDDDDSDLQWKLDVEQGPGVGLYNVKVSVKKEYATGGVIESQLCQMILDPTMRGSSLDRANPPATTPSSGTTPSTTTP